MEYSPESLDAETETTVSPTSAFDEQTLQMLRAFVDREGHVDVPTDHVEFIDGAPVSLGAWVNDMHVAYSRDKLTTEQVIVLEAVQGWLWAFPPASLNIDAADEADLARWFKNDDDFRAWLDAHDAWKEDLLATIVIERPAKEEPDPDDEDLAAWLAGRSDESGRRDLDYLFSEHHGSDAEATAMLAELVKFIEREGHTDVPYDYWFVDAAGVERPLYNWVGRPREVSARHALSRTHHRTRRHRRLGVASEA